jgi:hypothetical protein
VTGKDCELLPRFFSPGTPWTVTLTVYVPFGGDVLSGTSAVTCCPAVVVGTVVWPLTLVPWTDTLTTTFFSGFPPVFVNLTLNVGGGLAGIVFGEPVWSVVPPTLTESSECPWGPGVG